jgi:glycosyltransferase involved in cell wall biosynthesis
MHIGIDGRSLEEKRTGVGRYLESLLGQWASREHDTQFTVYYLNRMPGDPLFQNQHFTTQQVFFQDHLQTDLFAREFERAVPAIFFSPLYDLPDPVPCPAVITVHDMIHRAWPGAFNEIQLDYLVNRHRYSLKRADRIITDSLFAQKEIISEMAGLEKKISLIPLAPSPIFRIVEREPFFPQQQFGVEKPFIFYVGSITPKRHITPLLSAFEKLFPHYPAWSMILAGKNVTWPPVDIAALVKELNCRLGKNAVVYEEFVSDSELVKLYNSADIFAYLSTYEGFGMPPLEAMACGTPVLTTTCSSLPEVVGDAALTVDPFNPCAVEDALGSMMADEALRENLVKKGFQQVLKFSWKRTAEETMKVLKECAGKS